MVIQTDNIWHIIRYFRGRQVLYLGMLAFNQFSIGWFNFCFLWNWTKYAPPQTTSLHVTQEIVFDSVFSIVNLDVAPERGQPINAGLCRVGVSPALSIRSVQFHKQTVQRQISRNASKLRSNWIFSTTDPYAPFTTGKISLCQAWPEWNICLHFAS